MRPTMDDFFRNAAQCKDDSNLCSNSAYSNDKIGDDKKIDGTQYGFKSGEKVPANYFCLVEYKDIAYPGVFVNDTASVAHVFLQQENGNGGSVYTDTAGLLTLEKGKASRIVKYHNQPGVPMRVIYLLPSPTTASSAAGVKVTVLKMTKLEYYYDAATAGRLSTWAVITIIIGVTIVLLGCCLYCFCCKGKKGAATGDDDGYQRVGNQSRSSNSAAAQGAGGQAPRAGNQALVARIEQQRKERQAAEAAQQEV
jgi:hypothetical protein